MHAAVVDDMPLIQKQVEHILLRHQYEVKCYQRPGDAFWELKENPVDLLVVDLLMPEMNGLELRLCLENAWQADERFREARPLSILCTGSSADERINREETQLLERAKKADIFSAYLHKPISDQKLMAAIQEAKATLEARPQTDMQFTVAERQLVNSAKQIISKLRSLCRPELCALFHEHTGAFIDAAGCDHCPAMERQAPPERGGEGESGDEPRAEPACEEGELQAETCRTGSVSVLDEDLTS